MNKYSSAFKILFVTFNLLNYNSIENRNGECWKMANSNWKELSNNIKWWNQTIAHNQEEINNTKKKIKLYEEELVMNNEENHERGNWIDKHEYIVVNKEELKAAKDSLNERINIIEHLAKNPMSHTSNLKDVIKEITIQKMIMKIFGFPEFTEFEWKAIV
jgi:chromosome segregation ATPase